MSTQSIHNNEHVSNFAAAAKRYCHLIESHPALSKQEFVKQCAVLLPQLFSGAVNLLDVSVEPVEDFELARMTHEEWKATYDSLQVKLGSDDCYWDVFDPYLEEAPYTMSLGDDLSDIYRDLKPGLDAFGKTQMESNEAVREWRFYFLCHWGRHSACALRAIHRILEYSP